MKGLPMLSVEGRIRQIVAEQLGTDFDGELYT